MQHLLYSRKVFVPLLVGITSLVLWGNAWAQTGDILKLLKKQQRSEAGRGGSSLSVSPPMLILSGPPGGIAETKLTVFNGSSDDKIAHLVPWEARLVGPGKVANISDHAFLPEDSFVRNMEISPSNLLIPSQTEKIFVLRVKIPPSLKGVRYGGVNVALESRQKSAGGEKKDKEEENKYIVTTGLGVGVSQGIIMELTSEAEGEGEHTYEIEKIEITLPSSKTLLEAKATINNSSSYILNALMSAVVLDSSNKMVTQLKPRMPTKIQPGSSGTVFVSPSASAPPKGQYKMVVTVSGKKMASKTVTKEFSIGQ